MIQAAISPSLSEAGRLLAAEDWDAVETTAREIIKRGQPDDVVQAHHLLGRVLAFQRQNIEAEFHLREAVRLEPSYRGAHDDLIVFLDHQFNCYKDAQTERRVWWKKYGACRYQKRTYSNTLDPDRPLRIGFISGDFRLHSMLIVTCNTIFNNRTHHTHFFYATQPPQYHDGVTNGLRNAHQDRWRDLWDTTEEQALAIVENDNLDILVDLAGYTPFNGLPICAAKPAPINATAWGYAMPLGWPEGVMDYILTDDTMFPSRPKGVGERLAYLPSCIPFNSAVPEETDGYPSPLPERPRFAVFQRSNKIHKEALVAWRKILKQVPEAELVFKGPRYGPKLKAWILDILSSVKNRVIFEPVTPCGEHIKRYNTVSLSLDTWPPNGGVSTGESLWMGVPVLTLMGDVPMQRGGAAILHRVGLSQFVTTSVDDYVREAVSWATVRYQELGQIRRHLRMMLRWSPIYKDYDLAVGEVFQEIWRTYCKEHTT